jgi:CRISPR-associated protein Csm5
MSEKTKLKITTLTPVTIGSGAELSPYSDYVIDSNQVCFIDKKKMQDLILQKGEKYFDLYVEGIATKMDNNRSDFDLKSFLTNNQIVKNLGDVISYRCPFVGNTASKLPVKGLLKSPMQEPYFPGSSIKGALKTVLMYNWLKTNRNAEQKIEEVISGREIEKDGIKKRIPVGFDWLEKKFEYFVDQNELLHPNSIQQVTDSNLISKENIVVVDCYRKMPIRFECIAKNKTAEFELVMENYKWERLAVQANDFAFDALGRELKILKKQGKNKTDYYSTIDKLQETINDCPIDNNTAYLRIGFGKGYYLNSLGITIYDYLHDEVSNISNKNLYVKFEEYIKNQFPKSNQKGDLSLEEFPKTRLFVTKTQEPLGWVKMEKISN